MTTTELNTPNLQADLPPSLADITLVENWLEVLTGLKTREWRRIDVVGEGLRGGSAGNQVSHDDVLLGDTGRTIGLDDPYGLCPPSTAASAFADAIASPKEGHTSLLAGEPNAICMVPTVAVNKVTIKGAKQAVHNFGPCQVGVANAVNWLFGWLKKHGFITTEQCANLRIVAGKFIHWLANGDAQIMRYQFEATLLALLRALGLVANDGGGHPFAIQGLGENHGIDMLDVCTCDAATFAGKYANLGIAAPAEPKAALVQ